MNKGIDSSPFAFPLAWEVEQHTQPGMTLRDYFAGLAMQAIIGLKEAHTGKVAEWAYQHADAMLEARAK